MIILFPSLLKGMRAEIFFVWNEEKLSNIRFKINRIFDLLFKRPEMYKIENLKKKLTKINIYNQYQLIV